MSIFTNTTSGRGWHTVIFWAVWVLCMVLIPMFIGLTLAIAYGPVALAYPVDESGQVVDSPMPDIYELAPFLKTNGYAESTVCDARIRYICEEVWSVSQCYSALDPALVLAVISVESSFDEESSNSTGAVGLMQVIAKWHKARMARLGISNLSDSMSSSLVVGCDYLNELISGYGEDELETALVHYNAGPSGVRNQSKAGKAYAEKVLSAYNTISEYMYG